MKLSEACIRRPVLAWVLTLILILLGLVGYSRLAVQHLPKIDRPAVTIESRLHGMSPEIMESQVTRVIEEAMSGIEGLVTMDSKTSAELSKISMEFSPTRKMDDAVNDVRDRLSKVKRDLPHEMEDPSIIRSRADDVPVMTIALTSNKMETTELAEYTRAEIQGDLESIDGVSNVTVVGGGLIKMRLKLDPAKMSSYNISVMEVYQAIHQQNVEKGAGKLISKDREFLVTTVASSLRPEEFDLLPVAVREGHSILLKDIGYAERNVEDRQSRTRFNGTPGVSISVFKHSIANPIEVAQKIRDIIPKIQERLPGDLKITVGSDTSTYIEQSVNEVYRTILEATLLVILVVFAFLRSARASIIPLVTIPVSLIGTFFFMYLMGFTLNTISLLSLVLAIGLVVDDAIVVLENIYRRIEEGEKPLSAAVKGIREISFAVIAMTLTLAAVYTPLSLVEGFIGRMFTEFAISLAVSVIISGFAALTLSPMMCSRLLGHGDTSIGAKSAGWWLIVKERFPSDKVLDWCEAAYENTLSKTLKNPGKALIPGVILFIIGTFALLGLPRQLTLTEDRGRINITGHSNASSTVDYTDRYVKQIDDILATYPEIKRRVTNITNPSFDIFIELDPKRDRSTQEIREDIKKKLSHITGVFIRYDDKEQSSAQAVTLMVGANVSLAEVRGSSDILTHQLQRLGDIVDYILKSVISQTEEFTITINRNKASSLRIRPGDIADTVEALVKGKKAGTFKENNRLHDVIVEVHDEGRKTPTDITNLFIKANTKEETLVPIAELVDVHSKTGASDIYRVNKLRAVSASIFLKPGVGLNKGIEAVNETVAQLKADESIPKDTRVEFTGDTKRYLEESHNMILIVLMALAFIYLVLAAQFESWIDPLIIMLSVPMSMAGAAITLTLIEDGSLNIYSQIGLVTLIGLITKHGILIVEFANQLRDTQGYAKLRAVIEASKMRLRPILMTTFAMVLGAIPLALATGAGFESRRQIGWVVVGGMTIGTIFTLFVLPAIYLLMSRSHRKVLDLPNE